MNLVEYLKENPKSITFTVALVLTVLSVVFKENELITLALVLFTSVTGVSVKNYMQGAIENNDEGV